jgi:hypothetical protein
MVVFLVVLSVLTFLAAVVVLAAAKGAIHETMAAVLALISTVLFVGAGIIDALRANRKLLEGIPKVDADRLACPYCAEVLHLLHLAVDAGSAYAAGARGRVWARSFA